MVDLRWVVNPGQPTKLQFRVSTPSAPDQWTEWKDVPTVLVPPAEMQPGAN